MRELLRIIRFTSELKRFYYGVAAFSLLVAATTQVQPLLTKIIVDEVTKLVGDQDARTMVVIWAVLGIFLADLLQNVFSNIGGIVGDQLHVRLRKSLSERYFKHLLNQLCIKLFSFVHFHDFGLDMRTRKFFDFL